ncbi:MAG TPA: PAS domain S-box protein, partial [Thiobacillus sp.]|nr:PAS domain S-box protein [Thiobacillus sp.]
MFAYLKNRSLFNQLIVPMAMVGVIGAVAVIVSAFALQNSVEALGEMYSASGERLKTLQGIDIGIANVRALSLQHLASESAQNMVQIKSDLDSVKQQIEHTLPAISRLEMSGRREAQEEAAILNNVLATYLAEIDEAVLLSTEFEKESAIELLTRTDNQHLTNIQIAMQTLMRSTIEDIAASREQLIAVTNRNLKINLSVGFLGGAMFLGMAFYVSRRASVRIGELLKWSQRIAGGDLSNHLVADARDEVGQLTIAMHDMVQNLARGRGELEKARKDAETVAEELRQYANAFHSSGQAMLISDRFNRIVNVNATFTAQTGYSLDEVRGMDPKMLSGDKTPNPVFKDMWRSLRDNGYWNGELWDRKKTGEVYPKWASISAIRDADQKVMFYIASYSDIS